jgi:shikimate kinase
MLNSKANRIYLIGMMASGKSVIGEVLAKKLDYTFIDMDVEIEKNTGKSIIEIFTVYGEEYFRKLESRILRKLSYQSNVVISTGGGAPIYHKGIDMMLGTGIVVWLKVSKDTIHSRLKSDDRRPLALKITKFELSKMIRSRNPIYKQADIKVWNKENLEKIADKIAKRVKQFFSSQGIAMKSF